VFSAEGISTKVLYVPCRRDEELLSRLTARKELRKEDFSLTTRLVSSFREARKPGLEEGKEGE